MLLVEGAGQGLGSQEEDPGPWVRQHELDQRGPQGTKRRLQVEGWVPVEKWEGELVVGFAHSFWASAAAVDDPHWSQGWLVFVPPLSCLEQASLLRRNEGALRIKEKRTLTR